MVKRFLVVCCLVVGFAALAEMFPMLTEAERGAAKILLYNARRVYPPVDNLAWYAGFPPRTERHAAEGLAIALLKASALKPGSGEVNPDPFSSTASRFLALKEEPAADDEWQLELNFVLPDYHGTLRWNVFAEVDGERIQIAKNGFWKPEPGEQAYYERVVPCAVKLSKAPTSIKIVHNGYGEAGLSYVALANCKTRLVPKGVKATTGLVRDPANILEDTVRAAYFGDPCAREQMLHPSRGQVESSLILMLRKE